MHQAIGVATGFGNLENNAATAVVDKMKWLLKKDGFEWADDRIIASAGTPLLSGIKTAVEAFDLKTSRNKLGAWKATLSRILPWRSAPQRS